MRKQDIERLLMEYKEKRNLITNSIDSLIKGFRKMEKEYATAAIPTFESLLVGYSETYKNLRNNQRATAEEINILDVLGFTDEELRHSKFLAYLFNPLETHAQGNLFFEIFLSEVGLPKEYAKIDYKVKTEETHEESRIDIEIVSKKGGEDGFIIHIENKVGAVPDREQIEREGRDLEEKANALQIPENRRHAFLLSVEDKIDLGGTFFKWMGWSGITRCLDAFTKRAQAEKTKWVAEQYLECIRKHIIKERVKIEEEVKNEETE